MPATYDAVVIGGGVIGAATLFHLARLKCRRVLLLEKGELAGGATAKSSGIVRTHYSVAPNVAIARASLRMFQEFSALLDDSDADAGLVRSGYIIVAPPGNASSAVRRSIEMQQQMGVECSMLDRAEARARHPWLQLDDIDAIGFEAEAGFADPYLVTTGFARAARRLGAEIRTGTTVTNLLRTGDRIVGVQTAGGPIHAGVVLSALNVWSGAIGRWAGLNIPLGLSAHHVVHLAADQPYTNDLPVLKDLASTARLYMRPQGGHLLVGAGDEGAEVHDPDAWDIAANMDVLLDEMAQATVRLPAFAAGRFVRSWSGLYDTTPDWNPVLGPVPGVEGLQVAFGFSGHGFKLSPMVGLMLAQSLLGLEPELPLRPYRFGRFADGEPLVGAYGAGAVS